MATAMKKPKFKREAEVTPEEIESGHVMAFLYWGRVDNVTELPGEPRRVNCTNLETGTTFGVEGNDILEQAMSADQFDKTVKVNMSVMADKMSHAYRQPFTVTFEKKDKSMRKLRGYLLPKQAEISLGRAKVLDLDVPMDHEKGRVRWVDLRTIKSLIVGNVRYRLK